MSEQSSDRATRPFTAHPWHGIPLGDRAPETVTAFIEIVPTDTVKYELDKASGYLKVDRPQQFSNICPSLYGILPRTLCAEAVGARCARALGRATMAGDDDPLDVCVLTEKYITHGNLLVPAIPIGGLRIVDGEQADDKIVAVLQGDLVYGTWTDIRDCPPAVIERLQHYFLTYKAAPESRGPIELAGVYGRDEAHAVIRASQADYLARFGA